MVKVVRVILNVFCSNRFKRMVSIRRFIISLLCDITVVDFIPECKQKQGVLASYI